MGGDGSDGKPVPRLAAGLGHCRDIRKHPVRQAVVPRIRKHRLHRIDLGTAGRRELVAPALARSVERHNPDAIRRDSRADSRRMRVCLDITP